MKKKHLNEFILEFFFFEKEIEEKFFKNIF